MSVADNLFFLRLWLRNPRRVGAVAPSSRGLARRITAEVTPASGPVIELGPGTGAFTQALLERGVAASSLALIEADQTFAQTLERRYPGVRILSMDAAKLGDIEPLFAERAGAVVSGLPLLAMPAQTVEAIIGGVFARQLRVDGSLYQFTYGPRCPVRREVLDRYGLEAVRTGFALFNIPPASVYRIRRKGF